MCPSQSPVVNYANTTFLPRPKIIKGTSETFNKAYLLPAKKKKEIHPIFQFNINTNV